MAGSTARPGATRLQALQRPNWRFVVIDDEAVNAFVTAFLPGFVFVHRGLIELFEGHVEELSFVLGHELSHYLLEHGSQDTHLQGAISILQLVVLVTVDQTGVLALLAEVGLVGQALRYALAMPTARKHESEADTLGLQLCARTCCDPRVAVKAHARMAAHEETMGGSTSYTSIGASHPSTQDRLDSLQAQVPHAVALYESNGCHARKRILMRALRLVDH